MNSHIFDSKVFAMSIVIGLNGEERQVATKRQMLCQASTAFSFEKITFDVGLYLQLNHDQCENVL